MKRSTGLKILFSVSALTVVLFGFHLAQKSDFCRGWADHYSSRAVQLQTDAQNPALAPTARKELWVTAKTYELIARKYASVARAPWRPYPRRPLLTPEEYHLASTAPLH